MRLVWNAIQATTDVLLPWLECPSPHLLHIAVLTIDLPGGQKLAATTNQSLDYGRVTGLRPQGNLSHGKFVVKTNLKCFGFLYKDQPFCCSSDRRSYRICLPTVRKAATIPCAKR